MTAFIDCGGGASLGGIDTGDISHSLRFRSSASAYLSRTFGTPTDNKKWTWSGWVKRAVLASATPEQYLLRAQNGIANGGLSFDSTDDLKITLGSTTYRRWSGVYRDPSAHLHVVVVFDSDNATETSRGILYVNGSVRPISGGTISSGLTTAINAANAHYIAGNGAGFDGYLSRVCFVDGQALTPDSFGYLNTDINEWVSKSQSAVKAVVDAGGTNSFMLDFDDATSTTTLGYDKSSKGNNWTCNNISLTAGTTYDHMLDVPGNSYSGFNRLDPVVSVETITDGNLKLSANGIGVSMTRRSTVGITSGKWYWEVVQTTGGNNYARVGLVKDSAGLAGNSSVGYDAYGWGYQGQDGYKYTSGSGAAYGNTWTTNDVIGIAFDADTGSLYFYKNNVVQNSGTAAYTGLTNGPYYPAVSINSTTTVLVLNQGQRPFAYTPPTGFKALCQANLPDTGTVTVSGTFTGNLNADGPFVWMNGVPTTLTINGNAVTFGTHADKTAGGFKLRTASSSYNNTGSNTWTATIVSDSANLFKWNNAQGNP